MKTTVQTSRGPVRFHSVGEPIAGIPATQTPLSQDLTHFFASDHFLVRKAVYLEAEIAQFRADKLALIAALEACEAARGFDATRAARRLARVALKGGAL